MTKHTSKVVMPHLEGEEAMARFNAAVERRNRADFRCFRLLRDLDNEGALDKDALALALIGDKFKTLEGEDREFVEERAQEVRDALKERRDADIEFSDVLLGRTS